MQCGELDTLHLSSAQVATVFSSAGWVWYTTPHTFPWSIPQDPGPRTQRSVVVKGPLFTAKNELRYYTSSKNCSDSFTETFLLPNKWTLLASPTLELPLTPPLVNTDVHGLLLDTTKQQNSQGKGLHPPSDYIQANTQVLRYQNTGHIAVTRRPLTSAEQS